MTLLRKRLPTRRPRSPHPQQIGQGQAAEAEDTRFEEASPRDPIAMPSAVPENLQHAISPGLTYDREFQTAAHKCIRCLAMLQVRHILRASLDASEIEAY